MKHYQWSELDYIAGAAHVEGMSYGRYVACGMPNLEQFKRRADAGEFDHKPVRARSKRGTLAAQAPKTEKKKIPPSLTSPERQVHFIPESKCKRCGEVLPAEKRAGAPRSYCPACAKELRRARQAAYHKRVREGQKQETGARMVEAGS